MFNIHLHLNNKKIYKKNDWLFSDKSQSS